MVQIMIQLDDEGKMTVSAPFDNLLLCYGLLDMARDVAKEQNAKGKLVQVPSGSLLKFKSS